MFEQNLKPRIRDEKITDKEAVELAEFLELEYEQVSEISEDGPDTYACWIDDKCEPLELNGEPITYKPAIMEWLYSPEGQEALMDKLSADGVYVKTFPFNKYVGGKYSHENRLTEKDNFLRESLLATGNGPTRQDALLNATLAMKRKGK